MPCSLCGTRPAGTADGRCTVCAGFRRAAPGGLMPTPAGLNHLRSPVGLGRAAAVLLGSVAVADALSIAAGVHSRLLIRDGMADGFRSVSDAELDRADTLYGAAGTLQLLTLLATAVVFLVWLRRIRLNAEVFDPRAHTLRPGWAIGAWFVPIGNLWLPHRVVRGPRASCPAPPAAGPRPRAYCCTPGG
nr:DUF4328 domain-containing protein [Streptomyces sp. A0958]